MPFSYAQSGPHFEAWDQEPLKTAWPGFELCSDCSGAKRCPEAPHPYCRGWCHVCGGAGQWSLDPSVSWFTPATPMINLEHLRTKRQRGE